MSTHIKKSISVIAAIAFVGMMLFVGMHSVYAGGVADFSDTMTSQEISETGDHTVSFDTTADIAIGETIVFTWSTGFDISGATSPALTGFGAGVIAGQSITYTATATVTSGTTISGTFTDIVNPATSSEDAATGSTCPYSATGDEEDACYALVLSGTATDVAGSAVLPVLENDDVMITAEVQASFLFELHSDSDDVVGGEVFFDDYNNTVDLGLLTAAAGKFATIDAGSGGSTTAPTGGAHGFRAGTNASSGYVITVEGATLTNGNGDTIDAIGAAAAASTAGTEQFGFCLADDTTGTAGTSATDATQQGTIVAAYDCGGTGYAFDDTAVQTIANGNAAGPTSMTFYDVDYIGNITALTEAGNYMTELTYIGTATF